MNNTIVIKFVDNSEEQQKKFVESVLNLETDIFYNIAIHYYNYCPSITVNMAIATSGAATEYTSGKVTGLNQSVEYSDGVTLLGMVKSNVEGDEGDSGAVVFIPRTDANGGAIPIGIVSGGSPGFLGIGRTMYFTSINDLPGALQTGVY